MRGKLAVLAATTLAVLATNVVPAGAAEYGPGQYTKGPRNGDASVIAADADPATGKVAILQRNTRQSAAVNCVGDGPRATLLAVHTVTDAVSSVSVAYSEAMLSDNEIVIDVLATDGAGTAVGHKSTFGPMMNEAGTVEVPLWASPEPGDTMTVQFGLQTGAGCLPHPLIGLTGSRFVNGGQVVFTGVKVG